MKNLYMHIGLALSLALAGCATGGGSSKETESTLPKSRPIASTLPSRDNSAPTQIDNNEIARSNIELATQYYQMGQHDAAQEAAIRALAVAPRNTTALTLMGFIQLELKDTLRAKAVFDRALSEAPHNPEVVHNYGTYLCQTGNPQQAISYFDKAIETPTYRRAAVSQAAAGACLRMFGKDDLALARFNLALEIEPMQSQALLGAADLTIKSQGVQGAPRAKQLLARHLQVTRISAASLLLEVKIAKALGNKDDEVMAAADLRSNYPESLEAKELLKLSQTP